MEDYEGEGKGKSRKRREEKNGACALSGARQEREKRAEQERASPF